MKKATCAFCSKTMSVKALRYSHDKNCKGKVPTPEKEEAKQPPKVELETKATGQESRLTKAKLTRAEVKQQRLSSLVSQAF